MTREQRDELERRREALKQEISTETEAITDVAAQSPGKHSQLNRLRTVLGTRERELRDVEMRLARTV